MSVSLKPESSERKSTIGSVTNMTNGRTAIVHARRKLELSGREDVDSDVAVNEKTQRWTRREK